MTAPSNGPANRTREAGFTLLELSIVMSMLGLLMLVAFASFENFRMYAYRTSCVAQQRNLVTPGILFGYENGIDNQDISSMQVIAANLAPDNLGECPESQSFDNDDYLLIYANGELADVDCNVAGPRHPFHR